MMRAKLAPWWFLGLLWLLAAVLGTVQAATVATVTPGDWPLYRGSTIVSRHASQDACVAAARALGVARSYTCRTSTGVAVTITPDVCTAPQPATETQTVQCPAGTTGSWTQTRTYSAAPFPTCWTAGAWSPATAPAGACVATPPLPPSGAVGTWWLDDAELARLRATASTTEGAYFLNLIASAVANPASYNDIPGWQIALAGAIQQNVAYCTRAVAGAEAIVSADPTGANVSAKSEKFLRIPELIDEIMLPWIACKPQTTAAQRARWSTYVNAAIDQTWQSNDNYWPLDNAHNNYFFHYLYATAIVAVGSEGDNPRAAYWRTYFENKIRTRVLPEWTPPRWIGAGGAEGHYYDSYVRRLLWTLHLYGKATGVNFIPQIGFTPAQWLEYELHATRPDWSGFYQMGDEPNESSGPFTTGQRELWLLLIRLAADSPQAGQAKTLLAGSPSGADFPGRNSRVWNYVHSPSPVTALPISAKAERAHVAPSNGHAFIRSGWDKTAAGIALHFNRGVESHDHVDASGFEWWQGSTGLVVDPNAYGRSGILGASHSVGAEVANLVRLPNKAGSGNAPVLAVAEDNRGATIPHTYHVINAQPYWNTASVYRREVVTLDNLRVVVLFDRIVGGGAKLWQVNTPSAPVVTGDTVTAGALTVRNLFPSVPMQSASWAGMYEISGGVWAIRQADSADDYRSLKVLDAGGRVSTATLLQGVGFLEAQIAVAGAARRVRFFDDGSRATIN